MEAVSEGQVIVTHDGHEVRVLGGERGVDDAIALLDSAEELAGTPLVDEAERERLRDLAQGVRGTGRHGAAAGEVDHWHPLLATSGGGATGYAGVTIHEDEGSAAADLAVHRARTARDASEALLEGLRALARHHDVADLTVWIRHADDEDVRCAREVRFEVRRRLAVAGRSLDDLPADRELPAGLALRHYEDGDEAQVVEVLRAAYAGTPDSGWTRARFAERRAYDWFDPRDLLVADRGDRTLGGIHWTKRRGGDVGEVYNLAVHPDAQAIGLGRALLRAGLAHLAGRGCDEVLLWVDEDNEAGLALYASEGFTRRWTDILFGSATAAET